MPRQEMTFTGRDRGDLTARQDAAIQALRQVGPGRSLVSYRWDGDTLHAVFRDTDDQSRLNDLLVEAGVTNEIPLDEID